MEVIGNTAEKYGERPALRTKLGGIWTETNWKNYYEQIRVTARAFMALGLTPGKTVCILGTNRPEWFISDLAAIFAGGLASGMYITCSPEQCEYLASHSEANIVVVENKDQLAKFKKIRGNLPMLKAIVMMSGRDDDPKIFSWNDLPKYAEKVSEEELEERIKAQSPDDCCSLIYTSGTTGNPKGVMISHDNAIWTTQQVADTVNGNPDDRIISYLPLSHIAEQIVSLYYPIITGCSIWFAESLDKIGENLPEVRPTLFIGVPRVWEKIKTKIEEAGAETKGLKKKIAEWAKKKGKEAGYAEQEGKAKPSLYGLADKLVFSKVRKKLGLDDCRLRISTAAPISRKTLEFFMSLGIIVTEVYGMSECTGPATISMPKPFMYRTKWAGPVLKGGEIATDKDDGEVMMRGRHVFKGYFKNEKATKEAIDDKGWLHSGDVGVIKNGMLKITDRKKEIIITEGGENIAPQPIEKKLQDISGVAHAVLIGEQKKYVTALLTLDPESLKRVAKKIGSTAENCVEASICEKFEKYIQDEIGKVNKSLARVQTVKKFVILSGEFTIDGGELTHTMKLKRRVIDKKYAKTIESMYDNQKGFNNKTG